MNIEKLEGKIQSLVSNISEKKFIYDLLLAYEQPKASITRLKKGDYNLSKKQGEVLWKKKLFFKKETHHDLHSLIDKLKNDTAVIKQHPRFIIVTDFKTLLSVDTKTEDTLDIPIKDLAKYYDFFLPWTGIEKAQLQSENPADIKAAERMGRLYDLILEDNPVKNDEDRHALNIFLSRLLFCFFAEDTDIFADGQFTNALASHTSEDGSDLQAYLQKLFKVLNSQQRTKYAKFLQDFPYVNGGLFDKDYPVPKFSTKSRKIIIECGALNWKAINPDIFGSMMQAVVHSDQRSSMGMHYTSVVNIMKVIEPLFLNDLYSDLEKAGSNKKKLNKLLDRLCHLRIFDPACGSGNFLIIAYKELCKLEIEVLKRIHGKQKTFRFISNIKLTQFYGIELDDFAHETAKLSLWLAEHQMNLAFKEVFGKTRPTLPLQDGGNIVCGNATRLDWGELCPIEKEYITYILGNPPYLGARNQNKEQKSDMSFVYKGHKDYKDSDYVSCWFLKGAEYIKGSHSKLAFVSTNSICQGEQVGYLWPRILKLIEIDFAHQSFKWENNAKGNAGVTCVIVGLRNISSDKKTIFIGNTAKYASNISPYLHNGSSVFVTRTKKPISKLPQMVIGNMARDGGNLILSDNEKTELLNKFPFVAPIVKPLFGSQELIRGLTRWCLWIEDENIEMAQSVPEINRRIKNVYDFRISSKAKTTNQYSTTPHKFAQRCLKESNSIIVPSTSSERREYIPIGFLNPGVVITNSANAIYDAEIYIFAIISSRIHMTWVRNVAGRLKTDYRYSSAICYNTFPFLEITEKQKNILENHVFKVLDERELYSEKTMAELYDPDRMPEGLRRAHREMDLAVEKCYRKQPFKNDEERLEYLFNLYEKMVKAENN